MTESLAAVKIIMTIGIDDKCQNNHQKDNNDNNDNNDDDNNDDDDDKSEGTDNGNCTAEKRTVENGKKSHSSPSCLRALHVSSEELKCESNRKYLSEDVSSESKGEEDRDIYADNDIHTHDADDHDDHDMGKTDKNMIRSKNITTNISSTDSAESQQDDKKEIYDRKFTKNETSQTKQNISSHLSAKKDPLTLSVLKTNMLNKGHNHNQMPIVAASASASATATRTEDIHKKIALCNAHVLASTAGIARLKAYIDKDALHLSLVIHEPEIWRRYEL